MYACFLAVALSFPGQGTEPVAMALTTKGKITFERGKESRRLGAMTLLQAGDRIEVPADGEVTIILLQDGHRERVKAQKRATVERKGCLPAEAIERVPGPKLTEANLQSLRDLTISARGAVGVLRGENPARPLIVTPLYGATILTDRPTLTWPDTKADAYLVLLLSGAQGKEERTLWRITTKEPRLPFPEKQMPLQFGRKYRWRVIPMKGEDASADPIVDSKFLILTKFEIELLSHLKPLLESKSPSDLLLAAVSYEAHGVYDEGLKLYQRLADMTPEEANYQLTLASYYERAGRKDLANKARDQARKLGTEIKPK